MPDDDPFDVHQTFAATLTPATAEALQAKIDLLDALMSFFLWYHADEAGEFVAKWAADPDYASRVVADAMIQVDRIREAHGG